MEQNRPILYNIVTISVKESPLGETRRILCNWNQPRGRNANIVSQYLVKESANSRNTDNIVYTRTISAKESPLGKTRTILYKWNQPRGRNAKVISQYPVKESAESRNTDSIVDSRTISVKESPLGKTRRILYQKNRHAVETLLMYRRNVSRNQLRAEARTISWIRVQYPSRNHP